MSTTASDLLTGSTTEPQRLLDRTHRSRPAEQGRAAAPSTAAIVASLTPRTGKTLLARVLADYFVLSGTRPLVFDTDVASQSLRQTFPDDTVSVDLDLTRDQMTLFNTLAARSPEPRVIDVSHDVFRKFFRVMHDSQFIAHARTRHVEPVIFYIPDRNPDAYREALLLRDRFVCTLVMVDNAFVGAAKDLTQQGGDYRALAAHHWRMILPRLDPGLVAAVEDGDVSLGEVIGRPLSRGDAGEPGALSFDQRELLRRWIFAIFRDIHRVIRSAETGFPSFHVGAALS